jgi:hypothetical protein
MSQADMPPAIKPYARYLQDQDEKDSLLSLRAEEITSGRQSG